MPGAIKPTSVEGYLIRLYDTCEHMSTRMGQIEGRIDTLMAEDKEREQEICSRMKILEARVLEAESQARGVKDVKSSITPYMIAFLSCLLTIIGYVILNYVGIK